MKKLINKNSYNKLKVSVPTWNGKFELPGWSYFFSDIKDYFECTIKRHEFVTVNPQIKLYVNKKEKRIIFKTKTWN